MALTRSFRVTVAARIKADPAFAQALYDEALEAFTNGEPEVSRAILKDLINATIGFQELAEEIHTPDKSIQRMLGAKGNPGMAPLSKIFAAVKNKIHADSDLEVATA